MISEETSTAETVQSIAAFIANSKLSQLAHDHQWCIENRFEDTGLNPFTIVSHLYYRENLHSDILKVLLCPNISDRQGIKYLHKFLEFLNNIHGAKLEMNDFQHPVIEREKGGRREEGRIDILIWDEISHKAIIIENKINGAPDMLNQIPRYLDIVDANGLTCDVVVYLCLNRKGLPDSYEQIKDRINLISICAYDGTEEDLFNGWLLPCGVDESEAGYLFKNYAQLINKLGIASLINKKIMESFLELLQEDDNFKTAVTFKTMFDNLVQFRTDKILGEFERRYMPFIYFREHKKNHLFFFGLCLKEGSDSNLSIDIIVEAERYIFHFWDRNCSPVHTTEILQKFNRSDEFTMHENGYVFEKVFKFPSEEGALYSYITEFLKALYDYKSQVLPPIP